MYSLKNKLILIGWGIIYLLSLSNCAHDFSNVSPFTHYAYSSDYYLTQALLSSPQRTKLDNNLPNFEVPQSIGLLLPLQGPLTKTGQSIRNGFMAAAADDSSSSHPVIKIYDTSEQPIQTVYNHAIEEGNDFIVGPLVKANIKAISKHHQMAVPTLALNYSDLQYYPQYLYQLGLSPQDEAQQVAQKAHQAGYSKALLIIPNTAWGAGIDYAFTQSWEQLGGKIVAKLPYTAQTNLANAIKQVLKVDESTHRVKAINQLLGEKIQGTPQRRQDIDMVFLVASPRLARQINPILKFYYANDLPIYSTAYVYAGIPDPLQDRDLEGIIFCDIPWLFKDSKVHDQLAALWPKNEQQNQIRLYALGIDAYRVATHLNQINGLEGATGTLSMNEQGLILRHLKWARFSKGTLQPLSN